MTPDKAIQRFTPGQVEAVIRRVQPDCRPIFEFIRETGCRLEEALSLQHWQVQAENRLVVFSHNTKSGKFRYVGLTEAAIKAVKTLPKLDGCPYVFFNPRTGQRWHNCRKPWVKAREEAGVPQLRLKDLRSHYAIGLAEKGADMHDIQQALGHSSVSVTETHYAQFSPLHSSKRILHVLEGKKSRNKTETRSEVA